MPGTVRASSRNDLAIAIAVSAGLVLGGAVPPAHGVQHESAAAPTVAVNSDHSDRQDLSPFECGDLLVVGARGSGEREGLGDKVGDAVDLLRGMLDATRDVRYAELAYPAAAMSALAEDLGEAFTPGGSDWTYFSSVFRGTEELVEVLGDSLVHCPDERWVLVGYSQGALVIDQALMYYPQPERYAAIVKIADAGRTQGSGVHNTGTAQPGNGVTASTGGLPFSLPTNEVPAALAPVTVEICQEYDVVCDTSNALSSSDNRVAAIASGVTTHTDRYPQSVIWTAIDHVRSRILGVPVPTKRHVAVTSCLGEPVLSGSLTTLDRPVGEPGVQWSIAPGYDVELAASELGVVWDPARHFLHVDPDGTWEATLPVGGWSIPLVLESGAYLPGHAWIDISVAASCEAAYQCGPDLAPPDVRVLYPEGEITGRILCPDGRPAGGVSVQAWGMNNTWVTTDSRGMYRLPGGWGGYDEVYITAELNGFPPMVGGNPRGEAHDGLSGLMALDGQRVRAPDYRFTDFAYIEGSIDVIGGVRPGGVEAALVYAWAVPADGNDRWTFTSSEYQAGRDACLPYGGSDACARRLASTDGSYRIRVLPGDYKVLFREGWNRLYPEWHGSREIDVDGDPASPTESAVLVHAKPAATVNLGVKMLDYVAYLHGSAGTSEDGVTTDYSGTNLPVGTYVRTAGGWEFVNGQGQWWWSTGEFGGSSSSNWTMSMLPGEYRVVLNDPQAEGYDADYATMFVPGVYALEDASSISIERGQTLQAPIGRTVVPRKDAAVQKGVVLGTVTDAEGRPVEHASVTLHGDEMSYGATTDEHGNFRVSLAAGEYEASATWQHGGLESWWGGSDASNAITVVVDPISDTAGIDITLLRTQDLGSLSGVVRGAPYADHPLPSDFTSDVMVDLFRWGVPSWDSTQQAQWLWTDAVTTNANGQYTFEGLMPGKYALLVQPYNNSWLWSYSGGTAQIDSAQGVDLALGENLTLDVLVSRAVTLTGAVTAADGGAAAAGAWVHVESTDSSGGGVRSARVALDGSYRIDGLRPGDYIFRFEPDIWSGYAGEWWHDARERAQATPIAISTSDSLVEGIDAVLQAAPPLGVISRPVLTGTARVGSTLTASTGGWSHQPDDVVYQWLSDGQHFMNTTSATYTVTASDIGHRLSVRVRAAAAGFAPAAATSDQTSPIVAAVLTAPTPTISGTPATGSVLTAIAGSWTSGTTLSFQWYANGVAISGATRGTLPLTGGQSDKTITVKVTGKKSGYATMSKTSKGTLKVTTVATPTISGTVAHGATLTAKPGTWTVATTFSYQWYANGVAISGATKSTLVLVTAQKGKAITVTVMGKKSGYATVSKTSKPTAKVATVATPTIVGYAKVGKTLTARPGVWTSGTTFSYQWNANGVRINNATKSTFVPTTAQKGKTITVTVTGRKSGYATVAKTSAKTAPVP